MSTTTVHGVTVKCITSAEIQEASEHLMDEWGPNWRDKPAQRLALDTLYEAQLHIEAIESAARKLAFEEGRKAVRSGLGDLLKDLAPDALRAKGAL